MFADNDRISQRQLLRQMILALLGAWLLFLAGGVCQAGQNGLAGMALGFLLLAGWLLLLIRNAGVYENMEHYIGKAGRLLVIIVYLSFLVLTGSFLLRKISSLCGEYLISGISPEFLGLLLLLAAGAGIRNDIQQRARLAEIFYPFVMAGFVLMLILAAFHMRAESFADAAAFSLTEVAREGWRTLGAGAVLAVLPFLLGQVEQEKRLKRPLLEGLGKVWLFLTAAAVILIGTFGLEGVRRMEVPVIQLMAGTRLPGKFLERFDIVWLALLLCSILFALGSLLFYGTHLTEMRGDKGRIFRAAMGALIYGGSVLGQEGSGMEQWYPLMAERFYLPFFLILTLALRIFSRRTGKKRR